MRSGFLVHRWRTLLAVLLGTIAQSLLGADMTPIAVTGFNLDIVIEKTAKGPPFTAAAQAWSTFDDLVYYENGLFTNAPLSGLGLPVDRLFVSALGDGTQFQFQPYTNKNALVLGAAVGTNLGTLALLNPAQYKRLAVIANSTYGGGLDQMTLLFQDGKTSIIQYNASDWFYNTGYALKGVDRIAIASGVPQSNANDPRFYQTTVDLAALLGKSNQPLVSITFGKPLSAHATAIYALSGELDDAEPPLLLRAENLDAEHIRLGFSEPINANSAAQTSNYSVAGSEGNLTLFSARLETNQTEVVLQTAPLRDRVAYTITVNGITDLAAHAIATNTRATFTASVFSVTFTNPPDINYGTRLTSAQLNATANVPGAFSFYPAEGASLDAGARHLLTAVFTPSDLTRYLRTTNRAYLNVVPTPLVAVVNDVERLVGETNPLFSVTLSGLTNGDPILVSADCAATPSSPPGSYNITPFLSDPSQRLRNYVPIPNNGILRVKARPQVGPDLASFALRLARIYEQIQVHGSPVPAENPWRFFSSVQPAVSGSILQASLRSASGGHWDYNALFEIEQAFKEATDLTTAFPSGLYTVQVNGRQDGPFSMALQAGVRPGGTWPNQVPRLMDLAGILTPDVRRELLLKWEPWTNAPPDGRVSLTVATPSGSAVWKANHPATAVETRLPAYTLDSNAFYMVKLAFVTPVDQLVSTNGTGNSVVGGESTLEYQTRLYLNTSSQPYYSGWAAAYSTNTLPPGSDADQDGIPAYVEYALGLDPTLQEGPIRPSVRKTEKELLVGFPSRLPRPLLYWQASTDLATWTTVEPQALEALWSAQDAREHTLAGFALASSNAMFLRPAVRTPDELAGALLSIESNQPLPGSTLTLRMDRVDQYKLGFTCVSFNDTLVPVSAIDPLSNTISALIPFVSGDVQLGIANGLGVTQLGRTLRVEPTLPAGSSAGQLEASVLADLDAMAADLRQRPTNLATVAYSSEETNALAQLSQVLTGWKSEIAQALSEMPASEREQFAFLLLQLQRAAHNPTFTSMADGGSAPPRSKLVLHGSAAWMMTAEWDAISRDRLARMLNKGVGDEVTKALKLVAGLANLSPAARAALILLDWSYDIWNAALRCNPTELLAFDASINVPDTWYRNSAGAYAENFQGIFVGNRSAFQAFGEVTVKKIYDAFFELAEVPGLSQREEGKFKAVFGYLQDHDQEGLEKTAERLVSLFDRFKQYTKGGVYFHPNTHFLRLNVANQCQDAENRGEIRFSSDTWEIVPVKPGRVSLTVSVFDTLADRELSYPPVPLDLVIWNHSPRVQQWPQALTLDALHRATGRIVVSDPENDSISWRMVTPPAAGSVSINLQSGELIYTGTAHPAAKDLEETFTVGGGARTIQLQGTAGALSGDAFEVQLYDEHERWSNPSTPVLAKTTIQASSNAELYYIFTPASHGVVTPLFPGSQQVRYEPPAQATPSGTDEFRYQVRLKNGTEYSSEATVKILLSSPDSLVGTVATSEFVYFGTGPTACRYRGKMLNITMSALVENGTIAASQVTATYFEEYRPGTTCTVPLIPENTHSHTLRSAQVADGGLRLEYEQVSGSPSTSVAFTGNLNGTSSLEGTLTWKRAVPDDVSWSISVPITLRSK